MKLDKKNREAIDNWFASKSDDEVSKIFSSKAN